MTTEKNKKLEDLNLTQDELSRLTTAFKNEEFRKLLSEYAQEISDPENRARYEEEISMLENERGMDVKFVNPEPGHVIKTTLLDSNVKAFFNICKNENIEEAKCTRKNDESGNSGLAWSLPHSFSPIREDSDKKGGKCKVFDFVVHPNTYRMAESNSRFMKMLHDTALESAEKQFGVKLNRRFHKPKMNFKGTPTATVIRSRKDGVESKKDEESFLDKIPYPYDNKTSEEKAKEKTIEVAKENERKAKHKRNTGSGDSADEYTSPNYVIKHRSNLDLQQFTNARDSRPSTRPTELTIEIDLPSIKSASSVDLDIFEKELKLQSEAPVKYQLTISLPYAVDENRGVAKFDKSRQKLIVTLPVAKQQIVSLPDDETNSTESSNEAIKSLDPNSEEHDNSPLIEVLSSHETVNRDGMESDVSSCEESVEKQNGMATLESNVPPTDSSPMAPRIFYTCPNFDYVQDNECVTMILDVKNATRDSLVKNFVFQEDKCYGASVKLVSVGPGGFPMNYSFYVEFPDNQFINEQESYVSMNAENIVFTLVKKDNCIGIWERFNAGLDSEHNEMKVFLTEHNIQAKLDFLDQELDSRLGAAQNGNDLDLDVTDMNAHCLSVDIKEKQGSKQVISDSSAEDIKVVHNKAGPKIHSILKQRSRTLSESSDDVMFSGSLSRQQSALSTGGETSPTTVTEESENEEQSDSQNSGGRKKTVSFSEHIDQTVYKSTQSVSSMKSTLKNKRKKARRKEQKNAEKEKRQEGKRRRRNSNSLSEPSSDECGNGISNGHGRQNQGDGNDVRGNSSDECSNGNSNGHGQQNHGDDNDVRGNSSDECSNGNSNGHGRQNHGDDNDVRGNSSDECSNGNSNGHGQQNHGDDDIRENSSDECFGSQQSNGEVEEASGGDSLVVAEAGESCNGDIVSESATEENASSNGVESGSPPCDVQGDAGEEPERTLDSDDGDENEVGDPGDRPVVDKADTMLSWENGSHYAGDQRPQCAFDFTNKLMFELDVD